MHTSSESHSVECRYMGALCVDLATAPGSVPGHDPLRLPCDSGIFRGLLRGVLLARPKVTTQGCRRVARSAAGLVRANPPTGHHLPSRPSPSAICDLPPAGCCSASHQLAHLRIPWSNSWWQGMPRQHNQMQPQRQPPAGPSAHSPVQFLVPRPAGPHNQRQPRRPPACSPDRTN